MDGCIFCKIASGEVPAKVVYRAGDLLAIEDLNPQAPAHLLVMPVKHYEALWDVTSANHGDEKLAARLLEIAARLGRERGGAQGYRIVVNTGSDGGQTVGHVHLHVLAGRRMTWPPG
ncbi:MAG: histidine triad nucleotide-binding protein [Candidatus Eremiobacteraeota bacterium]|nr:histidine triad nucleotide-binding protein [Candidatus Eremiobacteraeota bacterium]